MSRAGGEQGTIPTVPHLPPATLQRVAAGYSAAVAVWRSSGNIAAARRRLERLAAAAAHLADAAGDLRPIDLRLAGLIQERAAALMASADECAAAAQHGLQVIADGRGFRGGNRPAAAMLSLSPRVALAAMLRAELGDVTKRELLDCLAEVLALAGEPDPAGLEDVLRALPGKRERSRAGSPIPQRELDG